MFAKIDYIVGRKTRPNKVKEYKSYNKYMLSDHVE